MENFNQPPMLYREEGQSAKFEVEGIMQSLGVDIANLLEKLKDRIDAHEYGGVLGVDGSGRVPALVLWKTINTIYKESGSDDELFANFIQGIRKGYDDREEKLFEEYLESLRDKLHGRKLLLVEDTINTGGSLVPIISVLNRLGIDHTVLTISFIMDYQDPKSLREIVGEDAQWSTLGVSSMYGKKRMSGVKKDAGSIFSVPYYKEGKSVHKENKIPRVSDYPNDSDIESSQNDEYRYTDHDIVSRTRKLAYSMAEKLAREYIGKEENE